MEEAKYNIAQANALREEGGRLSEDLVVCRRAGEVIVVAPDRVDLMDVSPKQLVSVAAALIPFLENDDAEPGPDGLEHAAPGGAARPVGRALRRHRAWRRGGARLGRGDRARRAGIVDQVDATRIVVRAPTRTTRPSRASTSIAAEVPALEPEHLHHAEAAGAGRRPGAKGDIIADGPSTEFGELALGRNVLVAFMPWNGYNFEDSILLSERIVKDDVFTSIHIEEFEVMARDTKLGPRRSRATSRTSRRRR
jgi:DNA-directed RNA polymerase subunit beta